MQTRSIKRRFAVYALGTIVLALAIPYSCFQLRYKRALEVQSRQAYESYLQREIRGRLDRIVHPRQSKYEVVLSIEVDTTAMGILSVGLAYVDDRFLQTVSEGDSAFKEPGSTVFRFCPATGSCTEHEIRLYGH